MNGRKQDLVTMRIPRELRDALRELAGKEDRSMVAQLRNLVKEASNER